MRDIVNASQIDQWFAPTKRDAQELLPHLVYKLISATIDLDHIQRLRIPVGDQIGKPGFDGAVAVSSEATHVPVGDSVWEMGVGDDAKAKADRDYTKRTRDTEERVRANTTFVFVTPRIWADKKNNKQRWEETKSEAGDWKAVRALDAIDLAAWLDICPAVARWLARQIGVPVAGVLDHGGYTKEAFEAQYGLEWSPDLIIGGREASQKAIRAWVQDPSSVLRVRGESPEEAALFVAACLGEVVNEDGVRLDSRVLYVNTPDALDVLTGLGSTHIVVALNHETRKRAIALSSPSIQTIAVLGQGAGTRSESKSVELGRIKRNACEEALKKLGFAESKAARMSRGSKGSLLALLWSVATEVDEPLPWCIGEPANELLPLLMAGQWAADSDADRDIVGTLAAKDYDAIKSGPLVRWQEPKGPLIQRSGIWDWMAWDYAWSQLASLIDADLIKRFKDAVLSILQEPDPRYELDPDKRWMANIYGKQRPHSEALIGGLTGSIAQLSIHSKSGTCPHGQGVAHGLVRTLLVPKTDRGLRWLSLAKWLPDLAEAAPDAFLEAIETLLGDESTAKLIFEEEKGGIFPSSMHTYVLWALERLAWSADYLSRATIVLGRLAAIDPGGTLHNRPRNSLFEIYVPWHPQTVADSSRRMDAIRALYNRCPNQAWELGCAVLPQSHSVVSPTAAPQWREWKPDEPIRVTVPEYWEFIDELVTELIGWANAEKSRWPKLIDEFPEIQNGYPDLGNRVMKAIEEIDAESLSTEEKSTIAETIRKIVTRHKQFPDSEWVLDDEPLSKLDACYDRFAPDDLVITKAWLFKSMPDLPERFSENHEAYQTRLNDERSKVISEIYGQSGLDGVRRLVEAVEQPNEVGAAFAELEVSAEDETDLLVTGLGTSPTKQDIPRSLQFAWGYIWRQRREHGLSWVQEKGDSLRDIIGSEGLANLALPIYAEERIWDIIDKWGNKTAEFYWARVGGLFLNDPDKELKRAVENLMKASRPYRAIDLVGMSIRRTKRKGGNESLDLPLEPQLAISLLDNAYQKNPKDEWYPASTAMLSYTLDELLEWLESREIDDKVLARIEWLWMPLLENNKRGLPVLQRSLSSQPELFVDMLKAVFKGENDTKVDLSEQDELRAGHAFRLLNQWTLVPGSKREETEAEGEVKVTIDEEVLRNWLAEARKQANECGRLAVCDSQIGQVFAHAPTDDDGTWPCESVRTMIEEVSSSELESGMHTGIMNKRGAHFRRRGGDQERELVTKYKGYRDRVIDRWPRTGSVLDGVHRSYESEAKWHDAIEEYEEFA